MTDFNHCRHSHVCSALYIMARIHNVIDGENISRGGRHKSLPSEILQLPRARVLFHMPLCVPQEGTLFL